MLRPRTTLGLGLLVSLAFGGCKQQEHFTDVQKHATRFVDFSGLVLLGHARQEFRIDVPGDVMHPAFEGRWTLADPEKPTEVYVIPGDIYRSDVAPALQDSVFWTSVRSTVGGFAAPYTDMHIHPTPGNWVVVFYNPLPGNLSRSTVSAEIDLTYFK